MIIRYLGPWGKGPSSPYGSWFPKRSSKSYNEEYSDP